MSTSKPGQSKNNLKGGDTMLAQIALSYPYGKKLYEKIARHISEKRLSAAQTLRKNDLAELIKFLARYRYIK